MVKLGEWFIAQGASEAFVRGLEQQLAGLSQCLRADVAAERTRRRRLAARARALAARFERDIDGQRLTIDALDDRPGPYRITWAFGQIRPVSRPTIARALIEAAELLDENPSWLRHKPKMPRDLVLAVADVLAERFYIVAARGGPQRARRPIAAIATISSIVAGRTISADQVRHFMKRATSRNRKLESGPKR